MTNIFSKFVNGHTYRGCSTEFECDDSDKQYCRLCHDADNCNVIDLSVNNIGHPGTWQAVPINCYTCKNEECNEQLPIQACTNNINQNCATVFAANGTVVQRGCSDLIYSGDNSNYCDENPQYCKFCKSNGCNIARSLEDFGDCLFCDGAENSDCVSRPENIKRARSCYKGCMTGLYPRNNDASPSYELSRGCWDDMDLDDREDCKTGTKSYCQVCEGTLCNKAKIPAERLRCNVCNGDNCDELKSTECTAFRESDQCFTLFTNKNNVERMGCASEFDISDLNLYAHHLLLCSGDNCNTFANFPTPISCISCNSSAEPECASNPTTNIATVCQAFPHTKCYTRIDMTGVTHRGCLSDVEDYLFADCTSVNSTSCKICATNNCNNMIFPKDRRSCINCDSDIYSDCENNPISFASICTLYEKNDSCVTKLEGDRTIRGCASEITCSTGGNSSSCRICNKTDNCNTVNLLPSFVGEPGKWQELPLQCHHCEGDECSNGNSIQKKCKGNNLQTCMTVFNAEGGVIQRGCSDYVFSTSAEYCDENMDKCFACKSNSCNNATKLDDYVDCYFCDSSENESCSVNFNPSKSKTRKCQKSCMVALYPKSNSINSSYELSRTCFDDLDVADRQECANGRNALCKTCNGARCNTMKLPDERLECYKCFGDDCEDMTPQDCVSYNPNDQCYVLYNNESSIVGMGCRSEFETDAVTAMLKQKKLLLCDGNRCNAPEKLPTPKLCSVCNSAENPLCATNPNLVGNITRCSTLPFTKCFTRINSDGYTERGCVGVLEENEFYGCIANTDNLCETCEGNKCNEINVYPENRRKCQQCNSYVDPQCGYLPNSNKICNIYKQNDQCITNYNNDITIRGCKSDMKCDNEKDPHSCRVCEDDGCNIVNMKRVNENGFPGKWQATPITCYTCNGDEECSSKGVFRPCLNNPYQNCMTVFNSTSGKVLQRGCSDLVEKSNQLYCEKNPEQCFRCNSNGCNEASSINQYVKCAYCDSDINANCTSNAAGIVTTRLCYKFCMSALYPLYKEDNPSYGLSRSCYDDMDIDDRELCAAGKIDNCKICNAEKCNIVDIPDNRLSCYICEGDDCKNPKSQKCPTYRPNDKCFNRFDENNQLVSLGCRSEYSNFEADYLLKKKRLLLCDGENCNSRDNIPIDQVCVLCNSRTDKNCAVSINDVKVQTVCATKPFTDCYSRVLSDGATERGCLSNLYDDEFLECLNSTSLTCRSCKGNNCNKNVFPYSRLQCHVCDSSYDSSCEENPDSLTICSTYDPEDTCVTAFRNNVTHRDCSSSLVCDVTNPSTCKKCSGDGCNTVNLAKKQDYNFGMWQDLPLNCLSCSGNDCNSERDTKSLTCNLNNRQDCVTVFDDAGKVMARGCSDKVGNEYCLEKEENCYNCKSNNCNNGSSIYDYDECIYCNSYNDHECVWNPLSTEQTRKCKGGCMTALFPSDNSDNPSYALIRTCLNDKELPDQKSCLNGKDKKCFACSGSKCNANKFPENRLSCYLCEGKTCEQPQATECPFYKNNDQCFIRFDESNSVSEMGCLSSFHNQDLESIIKTKSVFVCQGSNCNGLEKLSNIPTCAVCKSTDDIACAVSPATIGNFSTCGVFPYRSCYTKLTKYGTTERGCLSDLPADDFTACVLGNDTNCDICSESKCNQEIYPLNRQRCYSCTSEDDYTCESNPYKEAPCPIVSKTESCITALSANITVRGCKSLVYCDANDSDSCRSCFGSQCNSIDLFNKHDDGYHGVWQELPLKCHTCEGEHCLNSLGPAVACSKRNINQDCMTVFDGQGRVEHRGCSDDVEDYKDRYCRNYPGRCFKCKSNECNIAWSIEEYIECLFCDSANEPSCILNPDYNGLSSRKCLKNCMVAMKSDKVIRSCLDDKEIWVHHQCHQNNTNDCISCSGDKCNNLVLPPDRLKCHVCNDSSCSSSVSQYCENYNTTDFCFAKYENGLVKLMGCASSQDTNDIANWTSQHKLYKCESNDCNKLSSLPKDRVCLSCDSNKNSNCAQNPLEVQSTEICTAPNNKCLTQTNDSGHTIRRCFSNLNANEQSCEVLGTCEVCVEDNCNFQIYPRNRRECHICNSTADNSCTKNPSSLKICPIYNANDKCVTKLDSNGFLERGCASSEMQCSLSDSQHCHVCDTDGCNIIDLTGAAPVATNSIFLTLLLAITLVVAIQH